MNVVDSCGWLEYFADEPNADFFAPPIKDRRKLLVPTICLLEVFKRVLQQRDENAALQAMAAMYQGIVVDLDASLAITSAKISAETNLPPADSVVLAAARSNNATLWTQDADFNNIPGVKYKKKA
ncbi:MAG: type II toxin-antitoxin system VapC family toxin [Nitrospinota bacterium]